MLSRYRLADIAFKIVGVGSVGTRCAVALYVSDGGDRLVLQVKEACQSVLAPCAGKGPHAHQGKRGVVGRRLTQCASDIFLRWANDDQGHQYYMRQLRDMKTSVAYEQLKGPVLFSFADMCGGHSLWRMQSPVTAPGFRGIWAAPIGSTGRLAIFPNPAQIIAKRISERSSARSARERSQLKSSSVPADVRCGNLNWN